MDADELLDALVRSCGITGTGADPDTNRTAEQWDQWRGDGSAHTAYWVEDWPLVEAERPNLLTGLVVGCGVENSVSISLRAPALPAEDAEQAVDLHGMVRLMTSPDALTRAGEQFVAAARQAGFGLTALHGEQAPAVFASAPTGVPR